MADNPGNFMRPWRSSQGAAEDQARLAKDKADYDSAQTARKWTGSKPSNFYSGDKYSADLKSKIDREQADEDMFNRQKEAR